MTSALLRLLCVGRFVLASTGPKDLVIVLDESASQTTSDRYVNARLAVQGLLDLVTPADYVNVITVRHRDRWMDGWLSLLEDRHVLTGKGG